VTIDAQIPTPAPQAPPTWTVGWSRGRGCRELAERLGHAKAVKEDWAQASITHKLDLLVTRRIPNFDLVSVAVPYDMDLPAVRRVVAAVGEGPHSHLASEVAATLSTGLGVPGELATVARPGTESEEAPSRLVRVATAFPDMELRVIEGSTATELVKSLGDDTLLVLGAPGGSWLQRQIFGPGHRMRVAAPAGAVVVRHAPRRCFHAAGKASDVAAGPHLNAADALRLFPDPVIPIADSGRLIGIVRRSSLVGSEPTAEIGKYMEPPVSLAAAEPIEAAEDLRQFLDGGPIPVVDTSGKLVGAIPVDDETEAAG